jgi:hypothetical protein
LKRLCAADTICMDGTFQTAPAMYEQLVTIQSFKVHVTVSLPHIFFRAINSCLRFSC